MSSFVGRPQYQHMAPDNPSSVNDDRMRTWTVSTSHDVGTRLFSLTMRQKPGGAITTLLFTIARKLQEVKPELLIDTRPIELTVGVVGITGDFVLPDLPSSPKRPKRLLWIAGGIGVTPFLSMLNALTGNSATDADWDIKFILATREPEVLLPLVSAACRKSSTLRLALEVFSDRPIPPVAGVLSREYHGRLQRDFFVDPERKADLDEREIYLCGNESFEKAVLEALSHAGVDKTSVRREGFAY